jgi:CheY-like chemotaxis protein
MPHKLLLADDSVTIQRVIELTFADEDIDVIAVGDGQQAIERIERDRPDIVLADIGMPEKNGYEVAAFVKGQPHLAHIPVVLLTGAFEPVDEARARAIGCDGVLVKPFEPQVVINRVRDLLAGRRPRELWTTPPGVPTGPAPAPPREELAPSPLVAELPLARSEAAPAAAPAASLDEYFDRLDAAFREFGRGPAPVAESGEPPPAPAAPSPLGSTARGGSIEEELARWEDESPARPAASAAAAPASGGTTSSATSAAAVPVAASPAAAPPPLAEAFAALLAAEQSGGALGPLPAPGVSGVVVTEELVEQVTRRVLERLADRVVRETVGEVVARVAERLVREEIERLKQSAT